jgi:Ca2+-transporting ATPase
MKSSSEISQEMDLESQETGPAIPAPRKIFRPVVLVILAVRTFSSKAFNNKESPDSLGVSLLSPSHRVCVFRYSISIVILV